MSRSSRKTAVALAIAIAFVSVASACGAEDTRGTASASGGAAKANVARFECPKNASDAGASTRRRRGDKLHVVTTVAPITSIVANVAGDRAQVQGIIPEGTDSHTYEPKPSAAEIMAKADVVFVNGLRLEDPTKELAKGNRKDGSEIVELGTLTISPDEYIYDFSFPESAGKPNPHLWTNPPMASCYAAIAARVMARADPSNAGYYTANARAFTARVRELDSLFDKATATMPAKNRKLLTYHDAYAYFAVHYGWKIIGAIQVSNFEDPTPKQVTALIKQIRREQVPAIFGSEVFPSPVLAQLAKETGVEYVDRLRDDDLPAEPGLADHSYLGLMKFDFVTMISNLGGDASGLKRFDSSDVAPDRAGYPQ